MSEIEVKHDINKNYLIVHGHQEDDYMVQMLAGNKIKGFLDMEVREIDNEREYYYDITGKENLPQKTAREAWKYEEVVTLVAGVLEAVGKAREYLLSEEHFLLLPEYIYRDIDSGQVFLCYAWSESRNINEQFTQLFSYFLNAVDYEDEQAVKLVYQLYDVSREEQCTLQRLWSVFETANPVSASMNYKEEKVQNSEDFIAEGRKNKLLKGKARLEKKEENGSRLVEEKKGRVRKLKPEREELSFLEKIQTLLDRMSSEQKESDGIKIDNKIPIKKNKIVTTQTGIIAKKAEISEKVTPTNLEKGKVSVTGKKKTGVSYVREDMVKMSPRSAEHTQHTKQNQTVCNLAEKERGGVQKVYHCHLLPEDEKQTTISMAEFPFYIGRCQKDTNGLKEMTSISRMHCKIEQSEGKYYVSDLHSTNGTYVNRIKLTEGNKKELKDGDELSIADIKYRFSL